MTELRPNPLPGVIFFKSAERRSLFEPPAIFKVNDRNRSSFLDARSEGRRISPSLC
jgi:hypothetical protein